jgi:Double-GTPase 2/RIP homotypic interaction motif
VRWWERAFRRSRSSDSGADETTPSVTVSNSRGFQVGNKNRMTNIDNRVKNIDKRVTKTQNWFLFITQPIRRDAKRLAQALRPNGTDGGDQRKPARVSVLKDQYIAFWGPPGSGKTTYLAALDAAFSLADYQWILTGDNDESASFLIKAQDSLLHHQLFPPKTARWDRLDLVLSGSLMNGFYSLFPGHAKEKQVQIRMRVLDPAGEIYNSDRVESSSGRELIDELLNADGIIFFFDPEHEHANRDSYKYFHGMIRRLMRAYIERSSTKSGRRLPHRLAVCISKCDDLRVFMTARECDFLDVGEDGIPRVSQEHAEKLFETLCRVFGGGTSHLQRDIRRYFYEDNVRYFAISSIGYYLDSSMRFDVDDFRNFIPGDGEPDRIRGEIFPINLIGPLRWVSALGSYDFVSPRKRRQAAQFPPGLAERYLPARGIDTPSSIALPNPKIPRALPMPDAPAELLASDRARTELAEEPPTLPDVVPDDPDLNASLTWDSE